MKFIFEQTKLGHWFFRLEYGSRLHSDFSDTMAQILDMCEYDFINIIIECGGVRGFEINPELFLDDHFYFREYYQILEFEEKMEPYLVMAELMG